MDGSKTFTYCTFFRIFPIVYCTYVHRSVGSIAHLSCLFLIFSSISAFLRASEFDSPNLSALLFRVSRSTWGAPPILEVGPKREHVTKLERSSNLLNQKAFFCYYFVQQTYSSPLSCRIGLPWRPSWPRHWPPRIARPASWPSPHQLRGWRWQWRCWSRHWSKMELQPFSLQRLKRTKAELNHLK